MVKTKIRTQRDFKTPLEGFLFVFLSVLSFVFACGILIVILRFLAGGILG